MTLQAAPSPAPPPIEPGEADAPRRHTFAGVPVEAMERMMAKRMEQVVKYGHSLSADAQLPLAHLLREARTELTGALDYTQFRQLERAQDLIVATGAFLLAAYDRLQIEIEARAAPPAD